MKYQFNNHFLNILLKKLTLESKPSIITGSFTLNHQIHEKHRSKSVS